MPLQIIWKDTEHSAGVWFWVHLENNLKQVSKNEGLDKSFGLYVETCQTHLEPATSNRHTMNLLILKLKINSHDIMLNKMFQRIKQCFVCMIPGKSKQTFMASMS